MVAEAGATRRRLTTSRIVLQRPRILARLGLAVASFALCWGALASAAPVVVPPGSQQGALAVGFDDRGQLLAKICPTASCSIDGATPIPIPDDVKALAKRGSVQNIPIGAGRHVAWVQVPDQEKQRNYELVIAAPLGGTKPLVVFQGYTGFVTGEYGMRQGGMVFVSEKKADGSRSVVVGSRREDVTLCARPTVLAPKLLNPKDLKLYPAKVQRLSVKERNQATRLVAVKREAGARLAHQVLRAVGASSAVGAPQAIADGDPTTTWAENRSGAGRGEFVTLNVPPQVPIVGFDVMIRPPDDDSGKVPAGVSPKEFWLATADEVVNVTLPEDAWHEPGAIYRVSLPHPMKTDCLSLVTESAFDEGKQAQVTFAELGAVTEFDTTEIAGMVGALAGGGERAEAAKTVLMAAGPAAFEAVAKAFRQLDEGGRRVALDVIDQAPCELSTPTYVRALLGRYKAHSKHASDRLRRCGRKSAPYLVETIRIARPRARPLLANELGLVAPDLAVAAIAPFLSDPAKQRRRLLRIALARAAVDESADAAVRKVLTDPNLDARAHLDVMRALGESLQSYLPEAQKSFARLTKGKDFRTRYLLLRPAAALARRDPLARSYLANALSADKNKHIRFGAAAAASEYGLLKSELSKALVDPAVRVRRAAVEGLGAQRADDAAGLVSQRLKDDPWPMVRGAAAEALGKLGASAAVDEALGEALGDEAPSVKSATLVAIGQRRVIKLAESVRDLLADSDEPSEVRRAAANTAARLCDFEAVDTLTALALERNDPLQDRQQRSLSLDALRALADIGPADLRERLAPLMSPESAPGARQAATRALQTKPRCQAQ